MLTQENKYNEIKPKIDPLQYNEKIYIPEIFRIITRGGIAQW